MNSKKIAVVTGASGMLGLALIRRLSEEGYYIYAVVRPASKRIGNVPKAENIKIVECDLSDYAGLPELIGDGCGLFFHFAWEGTYGSSRNDMSLQIKNIHGALNAAKAAKELGCSVFVGAGSQAEYGRHEEKLSPYTPTAPENGYGTAKLCAGQMTRIYCRENHIRHIWDRIFSVYGEYDGMQTMVMSAITHFLNGEKPSFTAGEQLWDYLYCEDAAEAIYLSAVCGKDGSVYCVGSGKVRPLKEYIYVMRDAVGSGLETGLGEIPYSDKQVMYLCADISTLSEDTGFKPKYSFEQGIARTVEWLRSEREQ
ncbi:MAG: NAD-dependent epimerase/dehydratase family protein [Oscillospiraceae bacterium]